VTPASARSLRRRKVADLRVAEPGLSLRQMAKRLGISRDTVRRDLDDIDRASSQTAPQASEGAAESAPPVEVAAAVVAETAPPAEDPGAHAVEAVAQPAPVARLPRRMADTELTIDLARWPALRRDLAVLAETGISPEGLINQAVVVLAFGYRQGVRSGAIRPDRAFVVRDMAVGPPPGYGPQLSATAPAAGSSPGA
jgi:DNA-binding CsgD family transcriptional regulator